MLSVISSSRTRCPDRGKPHAENFPPERRRAAVIGAGELPFFGEWLVPADLRRLRDLAPIPRAIPRRSFSSWTSPLTSMRSSCSAPPQPKAS